MDINDWISVPVWTGPMIQEKSLVWIHSKIPSILLPLFFEESAWYNFDNHIENWRLKNSWKTSLFAFSTPRIGFKFRANTFFYDKLKIFCTLYLQLITSILLLLSETPNRQLRQILYGSFQKWERFITWYLQLETSYQLELKPKVTCSCSSRRRVVLVTGNGEDLPLCSQGKDKSSRKCGNNRLDSLTCCYFFYGYFCVVTENLKRLRRLPRIKMSLQK